jgi:hypothetical protein
LTKGQVAIRDWFRAMHDRTGNLPLFPGIFPDLDLMGAGKGANQAPGVGVVGCSAATTIAQ